MHHRLEEKTSLDHSEATGLHLRGDLLDVPPVVHPIETKSETPPGPLRDRTRSSRINSSGKCLAWRSARESPSSIGGATDLP